MFHTFYHIYLSFVLSTHLHHLSSTLYSVDSLHNTGCSILQRNIEIRKGDVH